jgi:hypothetical protein
MSGMSKPPPELTATGEPQTVDLDIALVREVLWVVVVGL